MISTHILDTSKGTPAPGITVKLQKQEGGVWKDLLSGLTDVDGRVSFECEKVKGLYQLIFQTEGYYQNSFYKNIPVVFQIDSTDRKYHVPLLLNPFGYSTYRGS